ncbi:histidine phosphatase family protein [Paenibacillus oleatilyticus]|uniref:histidine phosphatase family protein n=1 Tax=Paenibacillus oleatilyticus TaxID=2594886 RepID=UPI001C1F68EE|nr:histidine phosphatase family protein [Paenibacillus oleatilyticus]MBU7317152.1 histidine phosphatase family protein [Paenibacillus oleatilyticus]
MQTTLYLTRHGQTEWNLNKKMQGHLDSPLTDYGMRQAEWLKERLENIQFDAIYSSSSPRAVSTAQILSGNRPLPISTLDSLKEINMGLWEGQQIDWIQQQFPVQYDLFFNDPHLYRPTGHGESYSELLERTIPALNHILAEHQGQQVLIVTHRITLKVIMSYFLGKPLHEIGSMPDIHPTALCKMIMNNDVPKVELYGDTSHYRE